MSKVKQNKWDFKEQLEVGQAGEADFMEAYPHKLKVHPERDGDFVDSRGRKIELKTDTYCMTKTPNFFIERYSDFHKETPGSAWQALGHGCDIFVYMFIKNQTYFKFNDVPKLVERLDELLGERPGYVFIKNRGWITAGCKVKREDLEDLYEEYSW